jgi:hypothetical protein
MKKIVDITNTERVTVDITNTERVAVDITNTVRKSIDVGKIVTVTFSETNDVEGATITINGHSKTTDSNGEAQFNLIEYGDYDYTITKSGYEDYTGTLNVEDSDFTESVTLIPSTADVTITSTDYEGLAVEGAEITIPNAPGGSVTKTTDVNGQAVFELENGETYDYDMRYGGVLDENNFTVDDTFSETLSFGISINKLVRYWSSDKASRFTVSNDQIESVADVTGGHFASQDTGDYRPAYTLDDGVRSLGYYGVDGNSLQELAHEDTSFSEIFAVSFWINFKSVTDPGSGYNRFLGRGEDYSDDFNIMTNDGNTDIWMRINGYKDIHRDETTKLGLDIWRHVVLTYDAINNISKIYIDSVLDNTAEGSLPNINVDPLYGIYISLVSRPFNGYIDEIKFYKYIPAITEVQNDYNYGRKIHPA